ncbi:MAG: nitrate/TMAO reductase-like tetraheme cytochrome c subunit [Planctomycetota bacterium]|jgi:nitrate/TMAO reductase-like tetraheme cytochrome c subunit
MRWIAGIIVLAVVSLLLGTLFGPGPKPDPVPAGGFVSSTQCQECHPKVYEEWSESWHSKSWTDPDVRALSNDFANTDCIDCHAPKDIFTTGPGKRVLPRSDRRAQGVDCLACHRLPESMGGGVAGTTTNSQAACRPQIKTELARVEYCGSCHNQHKTVDQWRASSYAIKGKGYMDCRDCHMPVRADGSGRSHHFHGGHNIELVRSAVTLAAVRNAETPDEIQVSLHNHGAGHAFPTDERSRAADIFWRKTPADAKSEGGWTHLYRIRHPYRSEVDVPRTLVDAGETLLVSIEAARSDGPIQVALFFKLTPYFRDTVTGEAIPYSQITEPELDAKLVHMVEVAP